jgi:hypothetical protein
VDEGGYIVAGPPSFIQALARSRTPSSPRVTPATEQENRPEGAASASRFDSMADEGCVNYAHLRRCIVHECIAALA